MAEITTIACLYLLWKRERRRNARRLWVHHINRSRTELGEFHRLLQELRLDDDRFQRYLRSTPAQFDDLLARIGARISRLDTNYRRSISASERLSICLRYLATGDSYRTIANSFRVGVSTVSGIIPDVATAIWDCLVEEFMAVPTTDGWRSIAGRFEERWNFPLCCGALDGKHVVVKAPAHSGSQFFNYKGTFSLVLLAVVDAEYCFRVIDVGGYGRTSDGGILANSAFGAALQSGTLQLPADLPLPGADHRGPQPHVFVADEAFPLRKNLMRPFPGRNLPRERRVFNYRLSRARLVVENAFGILSSQWRVYRRAFEVNVDVAEKCVKATCVLHNFLRRTTPPSALRGNIPVGEEDPLPGLGRVAANNSVREAIRIREAFTSFFSAEGTVPWQDNLRRRRRRIVYLHVCGCTISLGGRQQQGAYHNLVQELRFDDARFAAYFRLNKCQFEQLLRIVAPSITKLDTKFRQAISPEERLCICLRYLATGDSFRSVAFGFRVGASTVAGIVHEVCAAIWTSLLADYMPRPDAAEWRKIAAEFSHLAFPNCLGAMDGKHVVIEAPPSSGSLYYNYKGTFSIVLLAVVDAKYRFRVVDIGAYGRNSDGGTLSASAFGTALSEHPGDSCRLPSPRRRTSWANATCVPGR
ncbi:Protein ALP1-like [Merluccius polli]|uniref:Protein ALP1-like n=1 Tax=Merluccius polli TaxID=89951 RepID=A0AA47MBY3_MERPO|nr:Protein ALP1-like [Merluccius polli]